KIQWWGCTEVLLLNHVIDWRGYGKNYIKNFSIVHHVWVFISIIISINSTIYTRFVAHIII
ncbi:hypothetical protein ACJX0J_025201, partial [Zea mays]